MAAHSSILGVENPMDRGAWWATKLDTTERLHFHFQLTLSLAWTSKEYAVFGIF